MFNVNIPSDPTTGKPPTVAALKRQLAVKIASFWALILDHVVYIDTVKFLAKQEVAPSVREALSVTNCGAIAYKGSRAMQYPYRVELQRPSPETLLRIADLLPGHILSELQLALDLFTDSLEIAETLAREWNLTLTLRWRGNSKTGRSHDTFYGAARKTQPTITARKTRRNWANYADLPSKLINQPVVHFEPRYASAALCYGRGLRTAGDLLAHDLTKMIELDFRFSVVNWGLLDKRVRNAAWHQYAQGGPRQPLAAIEQRLWDEIRAALAQVPDWETLDDMAAQDALDAHPLIRAAAVHLPFFDLSEQSKSSLISARADKGAQ
jgi:hypothetical protein